MTALQPSADRPSANRPGANRPGADADAHVSFDPDGPLPPEGVTVIEASAGTGKTYTLTSLVVRFVAEGVPVSRILAVTFTRMATGELRERVRTRMAEVHRCLDQAVRGGAVPAPGHAPRAGSPAGAPAVGGPVASGPVASGLAAGAGPVGDRVAALLATGPPEEVALRRDRLADALAQFDTATITTIHGFCHLAIAGLGSTGDAVPGTALLEDPADLRQEVVNALYLRGVVSEGELPFDLDAARWAVERAVQEPSVPLVPEPGESPVGRLARLTADARSEVSERLLREGLLTYDDMLSRLARTLEDPKRGPVAVQRLSGQYEVVVVDEFQDTDPVQWRIFEAAFGGGRSRLVLIGDPKQAIYGFRGADVFTYLEAVARSDRHLTLTVNYRSDQHLIEALEGLLHPLQLGHPDIKLRKVSAPEGSPRSRIPGPAIRMRILRDGHPDIPRNQNGTHKKPFVAEWVARDVAVHVKALLASGTPIRGDGGEPPRPVQPSDVAVLVRYNNQARLVRDALVGAGVPAVVTGSESVFGTEAAKDWLALLDGLIDPSSRRHAAAVALSPFVGMTPHQVAAASEGEWAGVHGRLARWSEAVTTAGMAVMYRRLLVEEGLPARMLGFDGGERQLTDLAHLARLLHNESRSEHEGPAGLRAWLAARIEAAGREQSDAEERTRRLDSDAEAVQVLTIHMAKGLEFPVVYCPYLWDAQQAKDGRRPVVTHEAGDGPGGSPGRRLLDVGGPVGRGGPDAKLRKEHFDRAVIEGRGEDLRLAYVALTRARHQLILHWAKGHGSHNSPLARILCGRDRGTGAVQGLPEEPDGGRIRSILEEVSSRTGGALAVETAGEGVTGSEPGGTGLPGAGVGPAGPLQPARMERALDSTWRRASYTSLTAAAHDSLYGVASEPEAPGTGDEPELPDDGGSGAASGDAGSGDHPVQAGPLALGIPDTFDVPSPFDGMRGGPAVGTAVHRVLERLDFQLAGDPTRLLQSVAASGVGSGPLPDPGILARGLGAALTTPLGPLLPGVRLCDISRSDRLDELAFELPVAGGDSCSWSGPPLPDRPPSPEPAPAVSAPAVSAPAAPAVSATDIADLLDRHLPAGGPLAGYADRLRDPLLASRWRGYLTGSLDLVFRRRGADGAPRWYLADYKTNVLARDGGPATAWHYRQEALDAEMQRSHYPLQALVYSVALHRYLRWRLGGYDPDMHLGGVLYLFLRGMVGAEAPEEEGRPVGVFSWAVPPALVLDLSDLLDRGRR